MRLQERFHLLFHICQITFLILPAATRKTGICAGRIHLPEERHMNIEGHLMHVFKKIDLFMKRRKLSPHKRISYMTMKIAVC